jgi:hypothetical protein
MWMFLEISAYFAFALVTSVILCIVFDLCDFPNAETDIATAVFISVHNNGELSHVSSFGGSHGSQNSLSTNVIYPSPPVAHFFD